MHDGATPDKDDKRYAAIPDFTDVPVDTVLRASDQIVNDLLPAIVRREADTDEYYAAHSTSV